MARPRVFLSSTYYDLKNVRVSISAFIKQQGYEPILNEAGSIPYGKQSPLENYCYDEIRNCDILVSIIGGRFGSSSKDNNQSISQNELKTALIEGKQVYIFIERDVYSEFTTYQKNKFDKIEWAHVDNPAIYAFIDEVRSLPNNNAIFPFETSQNIIDILRDQWAGLFQRLLMDRSRGDQVEMSKELSQSLSSVRRMIEVLTSKSDLNSPELYEIAAIEHPAFHRLKTLLSVTYRVFFTTFVEMSDWLKGRSWLPVDQAQWDDAQVAEWYPKKAQDSEEGFEILKVDKSIFDEKGRLRAVDHSTWSDALIRKEMYYPNEHSE